MEELIDVRSLISKIQSDKQEAIELGVLKKEKKLDDIHKNEIPYSLPDGWEWFRLGDYAFKITDYVASGSFASLKENVLITNEPNYAIMVKTADFSNNFSKNLTYTDEHGYTFLSNSNLFGGELILSNIGSIGKVFIVPNLGVPMTLASNTVMVKMSDKKLIKYLYYFFLSPLGQRTLKNISSGTSMMKFNKTQLKNIIVPIAPLKQQQNIVKLFDRLSILIENQNTQLKLLDELVKARFVEMFGEIEDCDKWESKIWNEVVTIKNGRDYKKVLVSDGGYPVVGTGGEIARASKYLCPENTIVVGRKGSINNPMLMKEKFWNVDTAFGVIPNSDYLHYQYFYCFCKFYNFMKLNKATTLPSTTKADLLKIRINIPPLELQNQFASFVEEIDKSRSRIQKSLEASQELFDSLMQEYFG